MRETRVKKNITRFENLLVFVYIFFSLPCKQPTLCRYILAAFRLTFQLFRPPLLPAGKSRNMLCGNNIGDGNFIHCYCRRCVYR